MKHIKPSRLVLLCLPLFLILSFFTPVLKIANAQTGPATQTLVARYEALRALTEGKEERGDDYLCRTQGAISGQPGMQLLLTLSQTEYENPSFSPLGSKSTTFPVPATLFGDSQSISCAKALALYYEAAYSGSSLAEKRKQFLDDYYEKPSGESNYRLKGDDDYGRGLFAEISSFKLSLISGRTDSFLLWRDRIISQGFNTCWSWDVSGLDIENASSDVKFEKDNWSKKPGAGNKSVGYMAEKAVEGRYDDGITTCEKLKDYIFDDSANHYILDFDTDALQDEINSATRQNKIESAREILSKDSAAAVKFCIAGSSAEQSFLNLTLDQQIDSIAKGLVDETGFTYGIRGGSSVNELSTAFIKDCLLNQSPIGQELQDALSITAPSAERTDGGLEGEIVRDCDGLIPTGWWGPLKLLRLDQWAANAFDWFGCKVIQATLGVAEALHSQAHDALATDENYFTSESVTSAWASFRTIANILFVIAFLLIILSTVIGGKF